MSADTPLGPEFWVRQVEKMGAQADGLRTAIEQALGLLRGGHGVQAVAVLEAALGEDDELMGVLRVQRPGGSA